MDIIDDREIVTRYCQFSIIQVDSERKFVTALIRHCCYEPQTTGVPNANL